MRRKQPAPAIRWSMNTEPTPISSENAPPILQTCLNLPEKRQGKVRDIYAIPADLAQAPSHPDMHSRENPDSTMHGDRLLMIATDRISAFDVVLPNAIPGKGCLLTEIATFWLRWIESQGLCKTHLLSTDVADIPDAAFANDSACTPRRDLLGRITIGTRCEVIPIECVVRGYLEGSGWKEYQQTSAVCGVRLPAGLRRCDKLPEPLFTPATKVDHGHDENICFEQAAKLVGHEQMTWLRNTSLNIYNAAAQYALARGIIIADTKFEFGIPLGRDKKPTQHKPILIDEALTPDSSRFWPAKTYTPGQTQPSFDKQFVREYLESLVNAGTWNKESPGPNLPDQVVQGTLTRYHQAISLLMEE